MGNVDELLDEKVLFHCSNEMEKYKCKACPSFETNFLILLKRHLQNDHEKESSNEVIYKCLNCCFVTYSKYLIVRHGFFSACTRNEDESLTEEPGTSFNKQPKDTYQLKSGQGLTKFIAQSNWESCIKSSYSRSTDINSLFCEHCSYKCSTNSNLKRHILSRHTKTDPELVQRFGCKQCPTNFAHRHSLKRHTLTNHTNSEHVSWFDCGQCKFKSKRKCDLQSHVKYLHSKPEDIQWFKCERCSSKFKQMRSLKLHVISYHTRPEDIQWFACNQCSLKFKRWTSLKNHVRRRHILKPRVIPWFTCDHCASIISGTEEFEQHLTCCPYRPENIQWFTCDHCSSKFQREENLKRHVTFYHSEPGDIQ